MSNTPAGPRAIKKQPQKAEKIRSLDIILQSNGYKAGFQTFREQITYIYEYSEKNFGFNKDKKFIHPITIRDISDMFQISRNAVFKHINTVRRDREREKNGESPRRNGRPFTLNDTQLNQVKEWLTTQEHHPPYSKLKHFTESTFEKKLDYPTYVELLQKLGYYLVKAKPIEDNRYFVTEESLDVFYAELETLTTVNDIPCAFCFNLDEEGYDEYTIAKEEIIIVEKEEKDNNKKTKYYPITRKNDHATFLAAINAYGDFVKPMIVTKRATVEADLLIHNLGPDKIMLKQTSKGYITSECFDEWFEEAFIPKLQDLRKKFNYDGMGILILDGASQHFSIPFFKLCKENNMHIIFLPPHSSNQTQPMDLGMFHVHKERIRHTNLELGDDSHFVTVVRNLYNAWEMTAISANIQGSWKAMGAAYEVSTLGCNIIRFKKDFALKLMSCEKTKDERKVIEEQRKLIGINKEISQRRIPVDIFNKFHFLNSEKVPKSLQNIVNQPKSSSTLNYPPSSPGKLLSALVHCDHAVAFPVVENYHQWRPKEKHEKTWTNLSFYQRFELELQSVGLGLTNEPIEKKN